MKTRDIIALIWIVLIFISAFVSVAFNKEWIFTAMWGVGFIIFVLRGINKTL